MGLHIVYVDLVPYFVGRINSHVSSSTRLASLKSQWMPVLSTLTTDCYFIFYLWSPYWQLFCLCFRRILLKPTDEKWVGFISSAPH
jgi:hypothetical protein